MVRSSSRPSVPPIRFGVSLPSNSSIRAQSSAPASASVSTAVAIPIFAQSSALASASVSTAVATSTFAQSTASASAQASSTVANPISISPASIPLQSSLVNEMSSAPRLPIYKPGDDDPVKFLAAAKVMCGLSSSDKEALDLMLRNCFNADVIRSCVEAGFVFNGDTTISAFGKQLKAMYGPIERPKDAIKRDFLLCGQSSGEDVRKYHRRLTTLGKDAAMSAEEIKAQFLKGVSVKWRQHLRSRPDFEELSSSDLAQTVAAWDEEDAQSLAFDAPKSSSSKGTSSAPSSQPTEVTAAIRSGSGKPKKGQSYRPKEQSGKQSEATVTSNFHPKKQSSANASSASATASGSQTSQPQGNYRCFICGDKTHHLNHHLGTSAYDFYMKARQAAKNPLGAIGDSILVRGKLGELSRDFVLDTGSDSSYIRWSLIPEELRSLVLPTKRMPPVTADNSTVLPLCGELVFPVTIDSKSESIAFLVVDSLVHPIILGLDAIRIFKLVIDSDANSVFRKSSSEQTVALSSLLALSSTSVYDAGDAMKEEPVVPAAVVVASDSAYVNPADVDAVSSHTIEVFTALKTAISPGEVKADLSQSQSSTINTLVKNYALSFWSSTNQRLVSTAAPMRLCIKEGSPIIRTGAYHHPPRDVEIGQAFFDECVKLGMLRRSTSPHRSQWFVVYDQVDDNGVVKPRVVMDLVRVNAACLVPSYSLPRLDDLRRRVFGAQFWCKLDLKRAFLAIRLHEDSSPWTAFVDTRGDVWEWTCVTFGLEGSPTYFQSVIDAALSGIKNAWAYIDDVVVWGKSFEECFAALQQVLQALRDANLLIATPKCRLMFSKVKVLGNLFSELGVEVDPSRLQALSDIKAPTTREELRSFFGAAEFIAGHVQQYGLMRSFLKPLLSSKVAFEWTQEHGEAFLALKKMLLSAEVLSFPDPDLPLIMETDASGLGYGALLYQESSDGKRLLIAAVSRPLKDVETRYSSQENEAGAVNWACKTLAPFVEAHKMFVIITDHESLQWMFNENQRNHKVLRWRADLAATRATIRYRAGSLNVVADFFSRYNLNLRLTDLVPALANKSVLAPMVPLFRWRDPSVLADLQSKDPLCLKLCNSLKTTAARNSMARELGLHELFLSAEGVLMAFSKAGKKPRPVIVAPAAICEEICSALHGLGHFALDRTVARVREQFFWPSLREDVVACIEACVPCAERNQPRGIKIPSGGLQSNHFNDLVAFDIQGPLQQTERYNQYILVGVDVFTKLMTAIPLESTKSADLIRAIKSYWIQSFGPFKRFLSDNGPNFASQEMTAWVKSIGAIVLHSTPYYPQGNGVVERMNRTVQDVIAKEPSEAQVDWDLLLPDVCWNINTAESSVTGFSPHFAVFGRQPNPVVNVNLTLPALGDQVAELALDRSQTDRTINQGNALRYARVQDSNAEKLPFLPFSEGDTVLAKSHDVPLGQIRKFKRMYTRRYLVKKLSYPNTAICVDEEGSEHKFNLLKLKRAPDSLRLNTPPFSSSEERLKGPSSPVNPSIAELDDKSTDALPRRVASRTRKPKEHAADEGY